MKFILSLLLLALALHSCQRQSPLFKLIPPEKTGITFTNTIVQNDSLNILTEEYIFNGGGVGVGDFNKDGLQDLFFTGNQVGNELYLNEGNFKFRNITERAGISGGDKWCSGVAVVDINSDGWLDVYVGATLKSNSQDRANLLFINEGLNEQGVPRFRESAEPYGLADSGNTTQSAFFDYDRDGDLDLYLLTNIIDTNFPGAYRPRIMDGTALNNDRLYRNNGNGTFTNVSKEAGIMVEGYGLGVTISDLNLDGWPDIYVTNDYQSNDLLWINNKDGTFINKAASFLKHQSASAMGNNIADINNDGLVDIIALDMMPEDNQRKKTMIGANTYNSYLYSERYKYEHQYIRNTLQLNNGPTQDGNASFSEIGLLSGIHQTDWSWSPLVADFDNDGFRDLIITNGFPRDVTDLDFMNYSQGTVGAVAGKYLLDSIPEVKISNYAYKNNGDLTFENVTQDWGLDHPSFSNGAATVDLDNDGDLDIVINNINDTAYIYENNLEKVVVSQDRSYYLKIAFRGPKSNPLGIGSKVLLYYNGNRQIYEHTLQRGYLSSMENRAHFGLGDVPSIDSLFIEWPDGRSNLLQNIQGNQQITLDYSESRDLKNQIAPKSRPLFIDISQQKGMDFVHEESDKIDFNIQPTLPHKFTQNGPAISVADINNDGLDDFFVGGAAGRKSTLFVQDTHGNFKGNTEFGISQDSIPEDLGALFFDADNDGDQDLYVVSGSYEFAPESELLQDRLYLNDGSGYFIRDENAIPKVNSSGSCVRAADYDRDGDLDLFVGGLVVPGSYPLPARSYLLENNHGKFSDVTDKLAPELGKIGLVKDALWSDFDNDGWVDLVMVGEWMPVTFVGNNTGRLFSIEKSGVESFTGWWGSLAAGDFDFDGDMDYVAGNLGLNTPYKGTPEKPLVIHADDFDGNGSLDAVLGCFIKGADGVERLYPIHSRDDLKSQLLRVRQDFQRYEHFGNATLHDVLTDQERTKALSYKATHMASSLIKNLGNGRFKVEPLPLKAQFSPIKGMLVRDFDSDGNLDVLTVGNDYGTETLTGRYDASVGLLLKGDGQGSFSPVESFASQFMADGDTKAMVLLYDLEDNPIILVSRNRDSLKSFVPNTPSFEKPLKLRDLDMYAILEYEDGKRQRFEFHYGFSYLSQSSRRLHIPKDVTKLTLYDSRGDLREIRITP